MEDEIIRIEHSAGNFFLAAKAPFENPYLSWESKGLLAYLFTKPSNWQVRFGDLYRHGPAGRTALRNILADLAHNGYLTRARERLPDGTFQWTTTVRENPLQTNQGSSTTGGSSTDGKPTPIVIMKSNKNKECDMPDGMSQAEPASSDVDTSSQEDELLDGPTYVDAGDEWGDKRSTRPKWQIPEDHPLLKRLMAACGHKFFSNHEQKTLWVHVKKQVTSIPPIIGPEWAEVAVSTIEKMVKQGTSIRLLNALKYLGNLEKMREWENTNGFAAQPGGGGKYKWD